MCAEIDIDMIIKGKSDKRNAKFSVKANNVKNSHYLLKLTFGNCIQSLYWEIFFSLILILHLYLVRETDHSDCIPS